MIYLDNAATTWPKPECVYQAVQECMRYAGGNPGRGGHWFARQAAQTLYDAREAAAQLFQAADSANIAFAYNATDALNMALFRFLKPGDRVITTAMEHNAVARPLRQLEQRGVGLAIIPCDRQGRVDMDLFQKELAIPAKAVVASHASNVTGTLQPIQEMAALADRNGSLLILDAAQTAGVEEIDARMPGIGMIAFSGHKGLLGPQGSGGLYVRKDIKLRPWRYGGTGSLSESDLQPEFMPDRLESGTPNMPGIAGLLAGLRFIETTGRAVIRGRLAVLTKALWEGLCSIPEVSLQGLGPGGQRTAVISFTIEGMDSALAAYQLDRQFQIACRAGLHCAPWAHQTLGTLATGGTLRFSPGFFTKEDEIQQAIEAVRTIAKKGDRG